MTPRAENDLLPCKDFGLWRKVLPRFTSPQIGHNFINRPVNFRSVWSTNYPNLSR
jgi:hypothetical protein